MPTATLDLLATLPREYNAAVDLLSRNIDAGRAGKVAFIDETGWHTYAEVAERAARWANVTRHLGVEMEQRVMLCMFDTVDFPTVFLGSMLAGVVPIPVSTLLTPENYAYLVADSRVRVAVVSEPLLPAFQPLLGKLPFLRHVVVSGVSGSAAPGTLALSELLEQAEPDVEPAPTTRDDIGLWLYSSGSTGAPKGTMHVHSSLIATALGAGQHVVQISENDLVFSVSKMSFAYGLGCSMTFPMSVGATSVLLSTPPNPTSIFGVLREHKPTVFAGVPTAYASMLAHPDLPAPSEMGFRVCLASGEGLPPTVGQRWEEHFGIEILDGIGCTEMLNHFISNRPGQNRYGTSGTPIPGYIAFLVDDNGRPVQQGDIGHLHIAGPSRADGYFNNREKSASTFRGPWTITGDKFHQDEDGYYHYEGRSDDMLNVGGLPVSPFDVESALISHEAVLEAAVVGKADPQGLVKPIAYVVVKDGVEVSDALADELKAHVRSRLAKYKFPRWVEFVDELPKTPTGKIQRFKLRLRASTED